LGGGSELLSILGSYGDTLSDSDVLTFRPTTPASLSSSI